MPDVRLSVTAGTTEATLILSVLRRAGDTPAIDTHTNDPPNPAVSLTVASDATTRFEIGDYIEWVADSTYDIARLTAVAPPTLTVVAGELGSTAADHAANAFFRKVGRFFALDAQRAINDSIQIDLYPHNVFSVYEAQLTSSSWAAESTLIKEIDDDAEFVFRAYQKTDNTPTELMPVAVSQPFYVDTGLAATNKKAIRLSRIPDDNNTIFVQYARIPAVGDLSQGMIRVVELGAAERLLAWEEANLLGERSIPQSGVIAPGQAARDSAYFAALKRQAIAAEAAVIARRHPRKPRRFHRAPHVRY